MKYLKNIDENFLFKKPIPNLELDLKYLYDDPFYDENIFYICNNCHSYKLTKIVKRGIQPPEFKCEVCGRMNYAPESITIEEYKKNLKK